MLTLGCYLPNMAVVDVNLHIKDVCYKMYDSSKLDEIPLSLPIPTYPFPLALSQPFLS